MTLDKKNKIVVVLIVLFIFSTLLYIIINPHNEDEMCSLKVNNLIELNGFENVEISKYEITVFPINKNILCLGKVINVSDENKNGSESVKISFATNTKLKSLIVFLVTFLFFIFFRLEILARINFTFLTFAFLIIGYFFDENIISFQSIFFVLHFIIPYFLINPSIEEITSKLKNFNKILFKKNNLVFLLVLLNFFTFKKILNNQFIIEYWLINYNSGFIKRGLFGTLITNLPFNLNTQIILIKLLLITFYILIFYFVNKLITNNKPDLLVIPFLIFSQFFLLNNLFDPFNIGRPEILGYLLILYLVSRDFPTTYNSVIVLTLFSIAIFTHEVNLFFLPAIIFIIYKSHFRLKILSVVILLFSTIFFIYSYLNIFDPSEDVINSICLEIKKYQIRDNICDGAVQWLFEEERNESFILKNLSFNIFKPDHYSYFSYIIPILASYYPILKFGARKNYSFYFINFLLFIPLFLLAKDWGRWVGMIYFINLIVSIKFNYFTNIKNISKITILNIIFISFYFLNPHCCSVNSLVYKEVLIRGTFFIYFFTFILINFQFLLKPFKKLNYKK